MKAICDQLYIPQRNPRLYPFSEAEDPAGAAAAAAELAAARKEDASLGGMLADEQVRLCERLYGMICEEWIFILFDKLNFLMCFE